MKPLVPSHVLEQVRLVAEQGMQTDIVIRRRDVAEQGSVVSPDDYGDDVVTYTETHETTEHGVKGWFYSVPEPVQKLDGGSLVTINTYRLFVPVGTDVLAGDEILVGDEAYIVSDTTAESTWLAMLTCTLRKRE